MLAAVAVETSRVRLGPAISTLPYHNPLMVAESYAMLDILSGGRLALGVGSGYLKHEFAGFNIAPEQKRERFDETLLLLKRLLAGERVTHEGKFHTVRDVALNIRPVQPAPPIYVAALAREGAYYIGRQGNRVMSIPYASFTAVDQLGTFEQDYRRGRAESGIAYPDGDDAIYTFHTHVAASDAAARRVAAAPFDLYVETRLYARRQIYDDVLASGLGLFGSVATVTDQLKTLGGMGVRHVALMMDFGLLPEQEVLRSMRLFVAEVAPRVQAAGY
jgi:alkanesulfonate monooxygenase SsuD/methylene tetrahydromethanopterin reductase-like flavin-dependent oxidoreductase (luciferase family)